jgi:peptidoglycan/xylan/chitin deacetylase (PgdA/CDA1 family)
MNQARKISKNILLKSLVYARQITYTLLGQVDSSLLKKRNIITVLAYHSVSNDGWRFSVNKKTLQKQISYLQKHFDFISLETLQKYVEGKTIITKPSIILTFDDGYKDILTMQEFFKKKNIKPALFILGNTKKPNWKELGDNSAKRQFLTKREILSLYRSGWEIGFHSSTHANLATLTETQLKEEIVLAKPLMEKELGIEIKYFAYPRGKYNEKVIQHVKKAKFKMALTMDDGIIKPSIPLLQVPRVGIDGTHSFKEFTTTFSPSVVTLRKVIKKSPLGRYL